MVLLMLAASSGPLQVWRAPSQVNPAVDGAGPAVTRAEPSRSASNPPEWPSWVGSLFALLGKVLVVAIVIAPVVIGAMRRFPQPRWRLPHAWRVRTMSLLPEVDERSHRIDVASARAALVGGSPRNAIVACWMQLERDAADVGLPRRAFETPTEYVERVVTSSSVDPAPIGELAALYREARFSNHDLPDDHRTRALVALDRVEAALRAGVQVPA